MITMLKKLKEHKIVTEFFDRITRYPYGTNPFKVCQSERLSKYKRLILINMQVEIKLIK